MITTHSIGSKANPRAFLNRSLNLFMSPDTSRDQRREAPSAEAKRKGDES